MRKRSYHRFPDIGENNVLWRERQWITRAPIRGNRLVVKYLLFYFCRARPVARCPQRWLRRFQFKARLFRRSVQSAAMNARENAMCADCGERMCGRMLCVQSAAKGCTVVCCYLNNLVVNKLVSPDFCCLLPTNLIGSLLITLIGA